jgi:hexulose-6-phosphate isomerase
MMNPLTSRRTAIKATAAAITLAYAGREIARADDPKQKLPILKTLKIGMVKGGKTLSEKFAIADEAGFDGIEIDSPGLDTEEILRAIDTSGLPVDGSVCSTHWDSRHTDPNPAVREKALHDLMVAIRQTHEVGGHTTLLVIGHGKDGSLKELNERSIPNIEKAIPLAAELGVVIAIENVWNHYLYNHDGDGNQSAKEFADFVDHFDSPWVGMQYDIGNHWKYGNPGEWIRTLGKRIVKLDIKGFSRKDSKFTRISEGDLPWQDVRSALADIKFNGWCAAEVDGGGLEELKRIAGEMDTALGLS